jgi:hypothetical protein
MLKSILIAFLAALVVVNLGGWAIEYFTEVRVNMAIRIPIIIGITFIAIIFSGAGSLVSKANKEKPE